eukprot:SAG11_NODE_1614_length_4579_cov_11.855357_3_plen_37_part_00
MLAPLLREQNTPHNRGCVATAVLLVDYVRVSEWVKK